MLLEADCQDPMRRGADASLQEKTGTVCQHLRLSRPRTCHGEKVAIGLENFKRRRFQARE
jgi:hypothetical protein